MRSILSLSIFLFFSFAFFSCGGGSTGTPHPSDLSSSAAENSFPFYLETKLPLTGKFQVLSSDGQKMVYETSLPVPWIPRDPDRSDLGKEPQIFPKNGFTLSDLAKGEYLFRIVISHQNSQGEIVIGAIETKQSVIGGQNSPLDFSKSFWIYPDDDGDGFSNIAELTDGYSEDEKPKSPGELFSWSSWNLLPTDPKDPNKHPMGSYLINPERIHPTSPDEMRNSRLIGEILSVQAGTNFTVIHFTSDGKTIKEKINFSSRIDGSFEVNLKNSAEEDKVILVATSQMNGDQLPDEKSILQLDEDVTSTEPGIPLAGKWMRITYRPLKIVRCQTAPGVDPIAGSGYVLIEGEGISPNAVENVVCFPSSGSEIPAFCGGNGSGKGGFVQASEVSVVSQTPLTTTLKIKIPSGAISGFPRVHTITARMDSYGECQKDQVVGVLQNGKTEADLYIPAVFAPYVALLGQTISIDIPVVNQGLREISSGTPIPYLTYISPNLVGTANDDEIIGGVDRTIFPDSPILTEPRKGVKDSEKILSGLNKGEFLYPNFSQNQYFLLPVPLSLDKFRSALFKAEVNPDQNKSRSVTEQNYANNSRAASHNTFIHYLDLHFSLMPPWGTIDFNGSTLRFWQDPQSGYIIPIDDSTPLQLKRNATLDVSLGTLINNGTFPLNRDKTNSSKYSPNMESPLSTESDIYKNNLKLYLKRDYAEGLLDLKKQAATELVEQANLLDQRTELPVLVHVYYSRYNTFDPKAAVLVQCESENGERKCEFCSDRLEWKEKKDIKILTVGPLNDEAKFDSGLGWLFIVAEAIQIDPKKVKNNAGVEYCSASDQERKKMHLKGSEEGIPMPDYKPSDNIIRIKINLMN